MLYNATVLSARQRNILAREHAILDAAQDILLHESQLDLSMPAMGSDLNEILFAYSAMTTGGFALHEADSLEATPHVPPAIDEFRRALHSLGDAYGWRFLTQEIDWNGAAADIRRTIFPQEAQRAYGGEEPGPAGKQAGSTEMKPRTNAHAGRSSWHSPGAGR